MSTVTTLMNKEDNQDLYDEKTKLEVINKTIYLKFKICIQIDKLIKYISVVLRCNINL